jgi:hypothetical protein
MPNIATTWGSALHARQVRAIALLSALLAVFGTAVVLISVRPTLHRGDTAGIIAGVGIVFGGYWLLVFTAYMVVAYSTARQVAKVTAAYGILSTCDNGILRHELRLHTHKRPADLSEECRQFLKDTLKAGEVSVSIDKSALTAKVEAFAFDLFPHPIRIVIKPDTEDQCAASVAAFTKLVFGLPVVDTHGVAIVVLFAQWIRGKPLRMSRVPWLMWRTVVSSVKSSGNAVAPVSSARGSP